MAPAGEKRAAKTRPDIRRAAAFRTPDAWLAIICLAWVPYAAAFIWSTTVVVDGQRFAVLFDDAMVSMRYARNLAEGRGLVWNAGERVEGITNLGWTLVMAAVHVLGFPRPLASLPIQALGAVCLLLNLILVWRLARHLSPSSVAPAAFATASTAFFNPLNNWSLQGMEVCFLAPVCAATALAGLRLLDDRHIPLWLWALLALAIVVRLDAAVICVALVVWGIVVSPKNRWRTLLCGGGVVTLAFGAQTAFRLIYYGDPLPNTYYLKMTGFPPVFRMTRGLAYTGFTLVQLLWPAVLLLSALAPQSVGFQRIMTLRFAQRLALPLTIAAAACAYSVYVGGDAWERIGGANRFVAPVIPLVLAATAALAWRAIQSSINQRPDHSRPLRVLASVAIVLSIVNQNAYRGFESLRMAALIDPPMFHHDNVRNVALAGLIDRTTLPAATVAIDYAGTAPYFSDRRFVDLLGKSDTYVARTTMHRGVIRRNPLLEFYPGHLKWDYAHSVGRLQPDMICAIWRRSEGNSGQYLGGFYLEDGFNGVSVYWRQHSPRVDWNNVPASASVVLPTTVNPLPS